MLAWITPEEPPGENICIKVYCPSGVAYEAALRGAILSLTEEENWEKVFLQDVDVVAAAFAGALDETLRWERCMPIGTVLMFARQDPPGGFLVCDGGGYDTNDYADLFEVIGYEFGGSGDTFNVPDLQERFPMGLGGAVSLSDTGGLAAVTLTEAELASHDHPINATIIPSNLAGTTPTYGYNLFPALSTENAGGDQPHENLPPYVALLPVIAYR